MLPLKSSELMLQSIESFETARMSTDVTCIWNWVKLSATINLKVQSKKLENLQKGKLLPTQLKSKTFSEHLSTEHVSIKPYLPKSSDSFLTNF